MTTQNFLSELAARGVILSAAGDHLDGDAPEDVLTDELLEELRRRKAELIAWLRSDQAAVENIEMHDSALFDVVITFHSHGEPRPLLIPQWREPAGWAPPF